MASHRLSLLTLAASIALGSFTLGAAPEPAQAAASQLRTQAPGWYRLMVGSVEVTALSDGTVPLAVDKLLHAPAGLVDKDLKLNFQASPLETSVNAWLLNTGSRLVLVDAGAGKLFGPALGQLAAQIRAAGYQPGQVDDILLTHLHPDHVGGLSDAGQRLFPNATIHADQRDADYWLDPARAAKATGDARGFFDGAMASLKPYVDAQRFAGFRGAAEVLPGIRSLPAPGHTEGHTAYVVESQGRRLVLIGDLIHVASVQLGSPRVTIAFDTDEREAAATRARVFGELARDGSLVAASHLDFPGLGHLRRNGKGWTWLPVGYSARLQ